EALGVVESGGRQVGNRRIHAVADREDLEFFRIEVRLAAWWAQEVVVHPLEQFRAGLDLLYRADAGVDLGVRQAEVEGQRLVLVQLVTVVHARRDLVSAETREAKLRVVGTRVGQVEAAADAVDGVVRIVETEVVVGGEAAGIDVDADALAGTEEVGLA